MDNYDKQISDLTTWFIERLTFPVCLTDYDYRIGIDSLDLLSKALTDKAFSVWLEKKNYELSYSQMCVSFFYAARKNKLLFLS